MRKFLLVTLIGMVLVMDIIGVAIEIKNNEERIHELWSKNATIVYVE